MLRGTFSVYVGETVRVRRTERGQGHKISSDHSIPLSFKHAFLYGEMKGEYERRKLKTPTIVFSFHTIVRVGVHKNNFMLQIKTDLSKLVSELSSIFCSNCSHNEMTEAATKALQNFYDRLVSDFLTNAKEYKYHCKYERRILICSEIIQFDVTRVLAADGSTHAILFDFMIPYGL